MITLMIQLTILEGGKQVGIIREKALTVVIYTSDPENPVRICFQRSWP